MEHSEADGDALAQLDEANFSSNILNCRSSAYIIIKLGCKKCNINITSAFKPESESWKTSWSLDVRD